MILRCIFFVGDMFSTRRVEQELHPPKLNIDTIEMMVWKLYLRLQIWRHFGVSILDFTGGVHP